MPFYVINHKWIFVFVFVIAKHVCESLECLDFQCRDGDSTLNRNCFRCNNVSVESQNDWKRYMDFMISISEKMNYEEQTRLLKYKKNVGMYCCKINKTMSKSEQCLIQFSSGSKDGLTHYSMGCEDLFEKNNLFVTMGCKKNHESTRCCGESHCNLPNINEMEYMNTQVKIYFPFLSNNSTNGYTFFIIGGISVILISISIFIFIKLKCNNKNHIHIPDDVNKFSIKKRLYCWRKLFPNIFIHKTRHGKDGINVLSSSESLMNHNSAKMTNNDLKDLEWSCSGSGSGKPVMTRRTAATDIVLVRQVGEGRFGSVWLGQWNSDNIAVKIFSSRDERSWSREKLIYQSNYLRHSNVLGFVTTDSRDNGIATELWLVTEFHELGSLFEYLHAHVLTVVEAIRMIRSITNGLAYLHMEINGLEQKPAIAHRDLKSRNILVKSCGECCIGDLGLALRVDEECSTLDPERVGTRRYMAPEIIKHRSDFFHEGLEAFKKADIYSYSLVMWEILRRTECVSLSITAHPYEMPYQDLVSGDPSVEEMRQVVCDQRQRPPINESWEHLHPLAEVSRAMRESWFDTPASRLTVMRLKKLMASAWQELNPLLETMPDLDCGSRWSFRVQPPSASSNTNTTTESQQKSHQHYRLTSPTSTTFSSASNNELAPNIVIPHISPSSSSSNVLL